MEFVLGSFSCFYIEIAYSKFKFLCIQVKNVKILGIQAQLRIQKSKIEKAHYPCSIDHTMRMNHCVIIAPDMKGNSINVI